MASSRRRASWSGAIGRHRVGEDDELVPAIHLTIEHLFVRACKPLAEQLGARLS